MEESITWRKIHDGSLLVHHSWSMVNGLAAETHRRDEIDSGLQRTELQCRGKSKYVISGRPTKIAEFWLLCCWCCRPAGLCFDSSSCRHPIFGSKGPGFLVPYLTARSILSLDWPEDIIHQRSGRFYLPVDSLLMTKLVLLCLLIWSQICDFYYR